MPVESLAELITSRLGKLGLSYREAADPERTQGLVTASTLNAIVKGTRPNPSPRVLEGVALALDVPLKRVQKAAGHQTELGPFDLPAKASRLNARERRTVLAIVDTLLAGRRDR